MARRGYGRCKRARAANRTDADQLGQATRNAAYAAAVALLVDEPDDNAVTRTCKAAERRRLRDEFLAFQVP